MIARTQLAGIQYVGIPGVTDACVEAVQRMLQYHDQLADATILTCGQSHCLFLTVNESDKVAVKSGFSSGYSGEGPRGLARTLQLLLDHGVPLEEIEVNQAVIDRLDASALTERDLANILAARPKRPTRLFDYIYDMSLAHREPGGQWGWFPPVIPFAIIDARIADLALRFQKEPNDALLQGFRRLEDTLRRRTGFKEHGAKLIALAFQGDHAGLKWKGALPSETVGRANLFTGAYMAHRNPKAHKETRDEVCSLLSEFLLLNHLFSLEASAVRNNYPVAQAKEPKT